MKKSRSLFPFLLAAIFIHLDGIALAQGQVFVVLRDVPEKPSIVVVPTNYYKADIKFADKVEEIILGFKLKVIQRPVIKRVTATKGAAKSESIGVEAKPAPEGAASSFGSQSLVEEYIAYEETGADFVLFTDEQFDRVKLIRIRDRELLATLGDLGEMGTPCYRAFNKEGEELGFSSSEEYCLFSLLEAAGLPVHMRDKAGGK